METVVKVSKEKLERNITLYYLYYLLLDPWFFGVILISSLTALAHMSLSEIYFMESVVMLLYAFFEIPSGALADYVGRKRTIIVGAFCIAFAMFWFASMDSRFDAWGANILVMLGISFVSGADKALISDTLHALGRESEIAKVQGKATGLRLFVVAWASLLGGFLAEKYGLRLPLYLCIPGVVCAALVASRFVEPYRMNNKEKSINTLADLLYEVGKLFVGVFRLTVRSLVFVANNKQMKWIIGFFTMLIVASKVWFFTYNPYFELVELKCRYFGVIFWGLNMVASFASVYAYKVIDRLPEEKVLMLSAGFISIPILLMGLFVSKGMASLVVCQNISRGIMGPLQFDMMDKHLSIENKATVLSIGTATNGIVQCVVLAGYGTILTMMGLSNMLVVLGFTVVLLSTYGIKKYYQYF